MEEEKDKTLVVPAELHLQLKKASVDGHIKLGLLTRAILTLGLYIRGNLDWARTKQIVRESEAWMNLEFGFGKLLTFEDTLERLKWQLRSDPEVKFTKRFGTKFSR